MAPQWGWHPPRLAPETPQRSEVPLVVRNEMETSTQCQCHSVGRSWDVPTYLSRTRNASVGARSPWTRRADPLEAGKHTIVFDFKSMVGVWAREGACSPWAARKSPGIPLSLPCGCSAKIRRRRSSTWLCNSYSRKIPRGDSGRRRVSQPVWAGRRQPHASWTFRQSPRAHFYYSN
jgi:hypothetical protein